MASLTPVSFKKTVAASGTEEALVSSKTFARSVRIKALHGNTNMVYVGAAGVASTTGYVLDAGEVLILDGVWNNGSQDFLDLNQIYIDVDTNGEGVTVFYYSGE